MPRLFSYICMMIVFAFAFPAASPAEEASAGYYALALPDKWTLAEEGDMAILSAPGGGPSLFIFLEAIPEPLAGVALERLVKERAGGRALTKLGGGYAYEDNSGQRHWAASREYALLDLGASEAFAGLPKLIASLNIYDAAPYDTEALFKAALDPKVLSWLMFGTP